MDALGTVCSFHTCVHKPAVANRDNPHLPHGRETHTHTQACIRHGTFARARGTYKTNGTTSPSCTLTRQLGAIASTLFARGLGRNMRRGVTCRTLDVGVTQQAARRNTTQA
jgi:hypothetical protein